MLVDILLTALIALTIGFLNAARALQCFSCHGQNGVCDGTYCVAVPSGYCVFQQQLDAYGKVLHVVEACLTQNSIRAGDALVTRVGQCVTNEDSKTGMRYRTYLCNNTDFCNLDCFDSAAPITTTIAPSPRSLKCYSCEQASENCFDEQCSALPNGYCLFQSQQLLINGIIQYHSIKRCIPAPYALTPSGNVITATNQCIQSIDASGSRYFTLLCNTTDLCNDHCIPTITSTTISTMQTPTTSSATSVLTTEFEAFLLIAFTLSFKAI
ncbi:hypothetical protein Tcan_09374 [Toxocara canis]|uniref:UPAR/Ly6 domain-containing protein n=1 Tax=Toxocara canis TaxID=6265 RepID=A0A0B2W4U8_TOXCA|nr:hypothetical protein Tcan_09374 [Toxocara canis]